MEKVARDLPDVDYSYTFDQSKFIERAIGNLKSNAIIGGLLDIHPMCFCIALGAP